MRQSIFKLQIDPQNHVEVLAPTGWYHEGVTGIGIRKRVGRDNEILDYWAQANPHGWLVEVTNSRGMHEEFQGATYNLGLEVASAIRRTI